MRVKENLSNSHRRVLRVFEHTECHHPSDHKEPQSLVTGSMRTCLRVHHYRVCVFIMRTCVHHYANVSTACSSLLINQLATTGMAGTKAGVVVNVSFHRQTSWIRTMRQRLTIDQPLRHHADQVPPCRTDCHDGKRSRVKPVMKNNVIPLSDMIRMQLHTVSCRVC